MPVYEGKGGVGRGVQRSVNGCMGDVMGVGAERERILTRFKVVSVLV